MSQTNQGDKKRFGWALAPAPCNVSSFRSKRVPLWSLTSVDFDTPEKNCRPKKPCPPPPPIRTSSGHPGELRAKWLRCVEGPEPWQLWPQLGLQGFVKLSRVVGSKGSRTSLQTFILRLRMLRGTIRNSPLKAPSPRSAAVLAQRDVEARGAAG